MKLLDYGDIEIHVDESGMFSATLDGVTIKSEKLDTLQDRIDKGTKASAKKIAVPVVLMDSPSGIFRRGEITGIHGGTGHYLFRCNGKTEQIRELDMGYYAYAITPEQEAELQEMKRTANAAKRAYDSRLFALRDDSALDRVKKALEVAE